MFTSQSTSDSEREITSFLNCAPIECVEHEKPAECPPLSFALPSGTDFTMSPLEAANKNYNGRIMPSTACLTACDGQLEEGGYSHWWAPVERLLGMLAVQAQDVFLVASSPWDGGPKGRIGAIFNRTPARQRGAVADILKSSQPVMGATAEALNLMAWNFTIDCIKPPLWCCSLDIVTRYMLLWLMLLMPFCSLSDFTLNSVAVCVQYTREVGAPRSDSGMGGRRALPG